MGSPGIIWVYRSSFGSSWQQTEKHGPTLLGYTRGIFIVHGHDCELFEFIDGVGPWKRRRLGPSRRALLCIVVVLDIDE